MELGRRCGDAPGLTVVGQVLGAVRSALEEAKITFDSADTTMQPTTSVPLETAEDAKKVLRLIDALDDHDDVQGVYANFDIPDPVLQALEV